MFESFIAKRIKFNKDGEKKVSPPAVRIAIAGIALGLTVMILSVAIVVGFKKEVSNKIVGFGSHIQISNFDSNISYETHPIVVTDTFLLELNAIKGVAHTSRFATKPGILKTDSDFQGIIIKGVDSDYNWDFFRRNIETGDIPDLNTEESSNHVIISRQLADKLKLDKGDSFLVYFVQDNVRVRKFHVSGIYKTDFSEYDELFILADIRHIRRLNQWENNMASGVEILLDDFDQMDTCMENLYEHFGYKQDSLGNTFYIRSIKDLNPMIFSWLDLLDLNVVIILILMMTVAGFTMISGLLIIILERTNMIGILKAMGANNSSIRKVFLQVAFWLVLKGLVWGNIIALTICGLQKKFEFLQLNPETYYLSTVPIHLSIWSLILLNVCTLTVSMLMLIVPSYIIAGISPAKTIRFE